MMPVHQKVLVEGHAYNGWSRRWKRLTGDTCGLRTRRLLGRFDVERLRCCALDVEDVTEPAQAGERDA